MHYLTLDTNTWIYLANGTEPARLLSYIKQEVDKNNIRLIVPETVKDEWNRNKENAVKHGVVKHFKEINEALSRIAKLLGEKAERDPFSFLLNDNEEEKEYFQDIIKKFKEKRKDVEDAIIENIKLIDELFSNQKTYVLDISDAVKIKGAEYAVLKKAPFKNRNSFADAIIYFSFIEFVKSSNIEGAKFITYNTEDFCEKKENKRYLHPDLAQDLADSKSIFYTIVGEAINSIEKDIISQEELEFIREAQLEAEREEDFSFCQVCDGTYNEIHFGRPIAVFDERRVPLRNPDQIVMPFGEEIGHRRIEKYFDVMKVGHCTWCHTEHFECPKCSAVNAVMEDEYNQRKECEGCGLSYLIEREYDSDGLDEVNYKILTDTLDCAKCGREFDNDGSGTNVCTFCEDEYSYGEEK